MTVQFIGSFTGAMTMYTQEKLSKIESKGISCDNVRVKLEMLPVGMCLEISINNKIRNSKKGEDFYALVVDVVDSICSQANRYKKYFNDRNSVKDVPIIEVNSFTEIARKKMLYLEAMSQDDAIEMMEALGHSFFIYKDIDYSEDVCVVYKRMNGSYGLIQCK